MDPKLETNRRRWDELVGVHLRSAFYDVERFRAGGCSLARPELELVGDVTGKRLLHLQCHFGLDTLSWARRGARATGVDFSPAAIAAARELATEVGLEARFVESDVLALDEHLEGEFDVVVTSWGTVGWLGDLDRWAAIIAHFLAPGGRFCMADLHPVASALGRADGPDDSLALVPRYAYFSAPEPDRDEEDGTYADPTARVANRESYWWNHSLSDVVEAIVGAGLRLDVFRELDWVPYDVFPFTRETQPGEWRLASDLSSLPLAYALRALRANG